MIARASLGWLLVFGASAAAAPSQPPSPSVMSWDFVITVADLSRGQLDVQMTVRGCGEPLTLRTYMDGSERAVRDLRAIGPNGAIALPPDPEVPGEWLAQPVRGEPLRLAYRYDLDAMSGRRGDPDYVARIGGDFVFNEQAVLLSPDPLPDDAAITVEFRLPPGVSVATPWEKLPGDGFRFRTDAHQYDGGSYIALGKLSTLGEIKVRGGVVNAVMLDRPHRASNEALRKWIERAASSVADFYGGLPGGRQLLVLAPTGGSDATQFGTTLRRATPSVVMFTGADAEAASYAHESMLIHEMFHTGNPLTEHRLPWLIEGFTTYYEDVLRGRSGGEPPEVAWSELADGFRRLCDPLHGRPLAEESLRIGELYNYARVYWGGACVAFQVDVAIRKHSDGKQSLDDVMRALRAPRPDPLTEAEVIAAFDRAAGRAMVRALLDTKKPAQLAPIYKELGIVSVGKERVRLRDDAPLAPLRRGIF